MESEDAIAQMLVGALLEGHSSKTALSLETLLVSYPGPICQFLPFCETPELSHSAIATPVHYHHLLSSPSPSPVVELNLASLLTEQPPRPLLLAQALAPRERKRCEREGGAPKGPPHGSEAFEA